jgi:hypothetical protein
LPGTKGKPRLIHGHASGPSPTYVVWQMMKQRCRNENHVSYPYYGGRGIEVCESWSIFENFLADMGERPTGMWIDRIDSDGDYEPGNCRWATPLKNIENRTSRMFKKGH